MRLTWFAYALGILIPFLSAASVASAAELQGVSRVIDGDTIVIGSERIRLEGIDAPETDQLCLDSSGKKWTCGIAVRDALTERMNGRTVRCQLDGTDRYRRALGICFIGTEDINAWLVRQGFALAYIKYSHRYVNEEEVARAGQRGLWSGAFIAPWNFRHRDANTEILGSIFVPIHSQFLLASAASAEGAPSVDCTIKGNVNRKGERIYHLPGSRSYLSIRMDKGSGERWFCSTEEAETAGWRSGR